MISAFSSIRWLQFRWSDGFQVTRAPPMDGVAMSNHKHRSSWILIGFIYDGFWYILEEDQMMCIWKWNDSWFEGMIYSSILKGHKQAHVCFWILYSEVDPCISICPVFALHGGVKFLLYPICCQDLLDIQIVLVPHDGLFILKSKPSNPFVVQDDSGTEKSSQTIWQGSIEGPPRKTRRGRNPLGFPGVLWYLYFGHPMIWMLQFQKWQYDDACANLLRIASVFKDIVVFTSFTSTLLHHHLYFWGDVWDDFGVRSVKKSHERFVPSNQTCRFSRFLRLSVRSFAVESGVDLTGLEVCKKSTEDS